MRPAGKDDPGSTKGNSRSLDMVKSEDPDMR
jgi:hypothetical protein